MAMLHDRPFTSIAHDNLSSLLIGPVPATTARRWRLPIGPDCRPNSTAASELPSPGTRHAATVLILTKAWGMLVVNDG
jgi:hypothetical protein